MAKTSKAKIEANNRYNAKAYDRINIAVAKGKKAVISSAAEAKGMSINAWMNDLIDRELQALGGGYGKDTPPTE